MKPYRFIICFLFLLLFLTTYISCVKFSGADEGILYYHLSNQSDSRIKVVCYGLWHSKHYSSSADDSIFFFNPGEERDLSVVYNVYNWKTEPENKDTLQGIRVLEIFKHDTISAKPNYLLRKYWIFSKPDEFKHVYSLTITNESFITE
ncbi:MAG: hypothetical protein ACOYNC_14755 [Bacteroidales bacterium]